METKVFDNGAAFAGVKSLHEKKAVQFLTVHANHERNRDSLGGDASIFWPDYLREGREWSKQA